METVAGNWSLIFFLTRVWNLSFDFVNLMAESQSIIEMVPCSWDHKCRGEWQEKITSVLSTFLLHMADAQQIFPVYWCPGAMVTKKTQLKVPWFLLHQCVPVDLLCVRWADWHFNDRDYSLAVSDWQISVFTDYFYTTLKGRRQIDFKEKILYICLPCF